MSLSLDVMFNHFIYGVYGLEGDRGSTGMLYVYTVRIRNVNARAAAVPHECTKSFHASEHFTIGFKLIKI